MEEKIPQSLRGMKSLRYASGISIPLLLISYVPIAAFAVYALYDREWLAFAILMVFLAFFTYLYATTYYLLENEKDLTVRCAFFHNQRIPIASIKQIEKTNSPLSAPALSLKRMWIHAENETALISPKDRKKFLNHLKKINPEIELKGWDER